MHKCSPAMQQFCQPLLATLPIILPHIGAIMATTVTVNHHYRRG
jgi:hypothetical protein